jgi:hypothetical protein
MLKHHKPPCSATASAARQRGSSLVLALFVLAVLTATGIALLFVTQGEVRMSHANARNEKAFYLAEAGLEHGLVELNGAGFALTAAAGLDGAIDFDPDTVQPVFDADGSVTGFAGFNDDTPLVGPRQLGGGWYAAFLTNDGVDGPASTVETNDRVTISSVGALRGGAVEVTVGIVESHTLVPSLPPALITLLGPTPDYAGGGDRTRFDGEDCGGSGIPGLYMPVIGTIGANAESAAEDGMCAGKTCEFIDYASGPYADKDTITDLTDPVNEPLVAGPIDPVWTDCQRLKDMIEQIRTRATSVCNGGGCALPATTSSSITFYDGDLTLGERETGEGLLVVTGKFDTMGYNHWRGMILVVGEGWAEPGNEDNSYSGGMVVADIAGPDGTYGTADDCSGGDNGFDSVYTNTVYEDNLWEYCSADMVGANPQLPYTLTHFRQQ